MKIRFFYIYYSIIQGIFGHKIFSNFDQNIISSVYNPFFIA